MDLESLGFDPYFAAHFAAYSDQQLIPARVAGEQRGWYNLYTAHGEALAQLAGRLRHQALARDDLPAVGDWVAARLDPGGAAAIHAVLPRRAKFSRKAANTVATEQIVATNVDTVFLLTGLDGDFNPRRLERYLAVAWESGAMPVAVLNKADLCADVPGALAALGAVAPGVPLHPISAAAGEGLDALAPYLLPGRTVALLGSSGVGKSTLGNRLLGQDRQRVQEVRAGDSRGRHTTTTRELLVLPGGALLIDTPGMRELQLWDAGVDDAFSEVAALTRDCRFRDCAHAQEPGCAVQEALADGRLDPGRYRNYLGLQREARHARLKQDQSARLAEKARWKAIHRQIREVYKQRLS